MACIVAMLVIVMHNRSASISAAPQLPQAHGASIPTDHQNLTNSQDTASALRPRNTPDPLEEAAKREIDSASMRIPGAQPETSTSDGRVHLRGGGSISKEEWEEAARKVQSSRLMRESMPPPPVN